MIYVFYANPGTSLSQERERPEDGEEDTWSVWGRIANDWDAKKKNSAYIKEMVRKGIPHHFRGIMWQLLCDAHNSPEKEQFAEYIKSTSACEKVFPKFLFNLVRILLFPVKTHFTKFKTIAVLPFDSSKR